MLRKLCRGKGGSTGLFSLFDSLIVVSNTNKKKLHLNNQQDLYFCNSVQTDNKTLNT